MAIMNLSGDALAAHLQGGDGAQLGNAANPPPDVPDVQSLASASAPPAQPKPFKIEPIGRDFSLDAALEKAYKVAEKFMNTILNQDALNVDVVQNEENFIGQVTDLNTGKMIKEYDGTDVLKFYAEGKKGTCVIIDGKI